MTHMIVGKPFFKLALLILLCFVLLGGILSLFRFNFWHRESSRPAGIEGSDLASYSPTTDLEAIDIELIQSARSSIDVAMYSFTDHKIELALFGAAERGVKVRIYRDALQYADEEARAKRTGSESAMDELGKAQNITIKVKGHAESMHLKAYYIDGITLRTGSANWSFSGETRQDNDLYIMKEKSAIQHFEMDFNTMWNRIDNKEIR